MTSSKPLGQSKSSLWKQPGSASLLTFFLVLSGFLQDMFFCVCLEKIEVESPWRGLIVVNLSSQTRLNKRSKCNLFRVLSEAVEHHRQWMAPPSEVSGNLTIWPKRCDHFYRPTKPCLNAQFGRAQFQVSGVRGMTRTKAARLLLR